MIGDLDFFVEQVDGFLRLEHSLDQVVVLIDLFFELFNAVVAELARRQNSSQRSAESSDQAEQGYDYGF